MSNRTPILQTCQCLVSEGWREALIKSASYEKENLFGKDMYVLRLDVLVRDDNGVKGIIKSVYYDSERIREIVTDVCKITGKSADKITDADFINVHCYAHVVQRTSKAGRLYNYIDWFLSFKDYQQYILDASQNDEESSDSAVTVPNVSTSTEQSCKSKDNPVDKVDVTANCPETPKDYDNENEHEFDFSDDEDEVDDDEEYFNFFDEED